MSIFDRFKKSSKEEVQEPVTSSSELILVPISGEVKDIKECEDPVFAQEIVGKGTLIVPSEGALYSPVDGTISMLAETGHALGITSVTGAEILIHVGLDTVELEGKPFTLKATKDQQVKKGDLLVEFDIDAIKAAGKSTQSPVIITNPDQYDINVLKSGNVSHGDELIEVKGI